MSDRFAQRIRDELVVEEPAETTLTTALKDAVGIRELDWTLHTQERFSDRTPTEQGFSLLLAQYAIYRLTDRKESYLVSCGELESHIGPGAADTVARHPWTDASDEYIKLQPEAWTPTAKLLANRYGDNGQESADDR